MTRTHVTSRPAVDLEHTAVARKALILGLIAVSLVGFTGTSVADTLTPASQFQWLQSLVGDWRLTPDQEGEAAKHPMIAPLVADGRVALRYRLVGSKTTVQENIFPDTPREMATMYHCADADCTQLTANHFCSLKNQPVLQATVQNTEKAVRFECDPSVAICNASAPHLQTLTVEQIPGDPEHLRTRFAIHKDGKLADTLVFRFERKR